MMHMPTQYSMNIAITESVLLFSYVPKRPHHVHHILTSVSKDMRAVALTHNNSRYYLCKDHLEYPLFQRRLWWYRCGWPIRVTLTSADDASIAAGLQVVEVAFDGIVDADVYVAAAALFPVVKTLRGVVLTEETVLHVARFGELRELHCVQLGCRNLRGLSCLAKLKHLQVATFGPDAGAVLDEVTEELPFLCGLQLGSVLPPFPHDASYFVRSMSRMALRMLALVPMHSLHYYEHAATCMKWYHRVIRMLDPGTHNLASDVSLQELPYLASACNGPDGTQYLSKALSDLFYVANNPSLFNTPHVHDTLVRMAQHATTAESVWAAAAAIYLVSRNNRRWPYGTAVMRDAIVSMAAYTTTTAARVTLAAAIGSIASDESAAKLFGVPSVRDALLQMAHHATTPESVCSTARAIIQVAEGNYLMFRTPATRDAIVSMAVYATSDDAVNNVSNAITNIIWYDEDAARVFGVPAVRDALLQMAVDATTPESVCSTARAIIQVREGNHLMFRTPATRDAIVSMAVYATSDDAVNNVSNAITNIIWSDEDAARVFGVPTVRDALLQMAVHAKTPGSVCSTARAIFEVAEGNHMMFRTPGTRDAIVSMAAYATSDDAVENVSNAISNIIRNDEDAAKLFGVPSVRGALLQMAEHATPESVSRTAGAIIHVAEGNDLMFWTPAMRNIILYNNSPVVLFGVPGMWGALFRMALRARTLRTGYTVALVIMRLLRADVRLLGVSDAVAKFSLFAVCCLASYVCFSLLSSAWTRMLEIVVHHYR